MTPVDGLTTAAAPVDAVIAAVGTAVESLRGVDLTALPAAQQLAALECLETVRRCFDHETDRLAGQVEVSGAYGIDGHRSAKAAVKARCRVTGPEAHNRLRCGRLLRSLPAVDAGYARGDIPTESARAIARTLSNPRVAGFGALVDEVFAEQAAAQTPEDFRAWLRDWERVADVDGAERTADANHQRRNASLLENSIDSSWTLRAGFGALQGSAMAEIFARFERAEFESDWAAAREIHGDETRMEHLARTPAQRRADTIFAIFRRAAAMPDDANEPQPLVNIVTDEKTFRESLDREAGAEPSTPDPTDIESRRCQTLGGTRLAPSEALAAALHGQVRRVVVDGMSTVIDLGRKRRLFTGCSRDAALLQSLLRNRDRLRCEWSGCDAPSHRIQVDHDDEWVDDGQTDVANSRTYCGPHNVLKHHLLRSGQDPGLVQMIRRPE